MNCSSRSYCQELLFVKKLPWITQQAVSIEQTHFLYATQIAFHWMYLAKKCQTQHFCAKIPLTRLLQKCVFLKRHIKRYCVEACLFFRHDQKIQNTENTQFYQKSLWTYQFHGFKCIFSLVSFQGHMKPQLIGLQQMRSV